MSCAELKPVSIAARLRKRWPEIERMLADGVPQSLIIHSLSEEGIVISIQTFRDYLHRERKRRKTHNDGSNHAPRLPIQSPGAGGAKTSVSMSDLQSAAAIEQSMPHLSKKERRKAHSEQYVNPVSCNPFSSQIKENES